MYRPKCSKSWQWDFLQLIELVGRVHTYRWCTCTIEARLWNGQCTSASIYIVNLHGCTIYGVKSTWKIRQVCLFIVHADASNGRGHYKDWGGSSTFSWAKNWLFSFFRSNLWGWVLSATFVTSVKIYIVGGQMLIWSPGYLVQAWIHRIGWAGHYFHSCCCSGSIQCRWHCMKSL